MRERENRFVRYLVSLKEREDRGALAALRRGLGKPPGTVAETHRYVLQGLPNAAPEDNLDPFYLVASLFAWHPTSGATGAPVASLGASLRSLAQKTQSEGVERRFIAMLNCHRDDLPVHLRHAVGLLRSKDVPIDWAQLLTDIRGWDHEDRYVQRRWARGFWASKGGPP